MRSLDRLVARLAVALPSDKICYENDKNECSESTADCNRNDVVGTVVRRTVSIWKKSEYNIKRYNNLNCVSNCRLSLLLSVSVFVYQCVSQSVSVFVCLSVFVYQCVSQSVSLFINVSVCLSICLSVFVCQSVYLSVSEFVYQCVSQSHTTLHLRPTVRLSVCLSVCLPTSLTNFPFSNLLPTSCHTKQSTTLTRGKVTTSCDIKRLHVHILNHHHHQLLLHRIIQAE